jgi:[protein-PII] uridylyltransferase
VSVLAAAAPTLEADAERRKRLRADRDAAFAAFMGGGTVARLFDRLTRLTDEAVRTLWTLAGLGQDACLVAVGGYGRSELLPGSDIDLLILVPEPPSPTLEPRIEAFIGRCWDLGLEIGQSVRSVQQCLQESDADVTVQTSLLERRFLCGDRGLMQDLVAALAGHFEARAFFHAKVFEMRQRHARYEDSPYSLEPNVKESPGGLRDLQSILWVCRAAGLGDSWQQLARRGLITTAEARLLGANLRRLQTIRARLHLVARRREDRLVFDLQASLARASGIVLEDARQASEQFMQAYYRTAKSVTQLTTLVLQEVEAALFPEHAGPGEPIDSEFIHIGGLLQARDDQLFERDPGAILRAFLRVCEHPGLSGITNRSLRALWHARRLMNADFRRQPEHRAAFLALLQQPRGVTRQLRRMNQWSVLGRYLPAFRRIVGRMQHDLFHIYTVDQHILTVVRNLRRFTMDEHAHEYPFCSELIAAFDQPWLLIIAALFHDIAKGRGGDHSVLGRVDAIRFCRDHGLSSADTELVGFLVAEHLTMSQVAQKQDLSDPEVIQSFAARMGSERHLTALYLLTVADIRGTSPKVWNAWKGKLLEDLFRATRRILREGHAGASGSTSALLDHRKQEALRLLNFAGIDPAAYQDFWARLDIGYFLRTDPQDIAWQTRVLHRRVDSTVPVVRTRISPFGAGFEVVTYLPDQPDLFARICGYFDRKNLSVIDARIHTTRDGRALDSFLIVDPGQTDAEGRYRDILQLVEVELAQRLAERPELEPPVRGRPSRRSRSFPISPRVELRPDERGRHYLLSITANDRTGLLYSIARVLGQHGLNLQTARIMTLGDRVEDVFLIDGPGLSQGRIQRQLEHDLLQVMSA